MVHCLHGNVFYCTVWCPSAYTSLQALKAFHWAAMAFSTCSFHPSFHYANGGAELCHTSSVVLSSPVLMLFQISSVAASARPHMRVEDLEMIAHLRVLSFQTLRQGVNLCLDFGGTSILMLHTRSWCCRATSSPGITFTSVTSLCMVLRKRMKSICVATFSDLYVMRCCQVSWHMCTQEAGWMQGIL